MFDNLHLSAQQGFTPVIARAKFQDRVNEHEHALEFRSNKPPNYNEEVKYGLEKSELAMLLKGVSR
jgi:hypothetical protein